MKFGEALKYELEQIAKLNGKVFPVLTPGSTTCPFLTYKRKDGSFKKTLSGKTNLRKMVYELVVVSKDYVEIEQLVDEISDLMFSFIDTNIGINGPLIQDVTLTLQDEYFAYEPDLIGSPMQLEVTY